MDKLVNIIGPAPSELSQADLLTRVRTERERVRRAIELFKGRMLTRPKGGKKGLTKKAINEILKDAGLTPEQLNEFLVQEKKKREERETNGT